VIPSEIDGSGRWSRRAGPSTWRPHPCVLGDSFSSGEMAVPRSGPGRPSTSADLPPPPVADDPARPISGVPIEYHPVGGEGENCTTGARDEKRSRDDRSRDAENTQPDGVCSENSPDESQAITRGREKHSERTHPEVTGSGTEGRFAAAMTTSRGPQRTGNVATQPIDEAGGDDG